MKAMSKKEEVLENLNSDPNLSKVKTNVDLPVLSLQGRVSLWSMHLKLLN